VVIFDGKKQALGIVDTLYCLASVNHKIRTGGQLTDAPNVESTQSSRLLRHLFELDF